MSLHVIQILNKFVLINPKVVVLSDFDPLLPYPSLLYYHPTQ